LNSRNRDKYIEIIRAKLQNFENPDDQIEALGLFSSFLGRISESAKEDGKEVLDSIINIAHNSQKAKVRIKAVRALGNLAIEPDKVLPILDRIMWIDKSFFVKEEIPIALSNFGEHGINYLKKALFKGKGSIRINAIKAFGRIEQKKGEIKSLLSKELQKTQDVNERFWILFSLIQLQGLESKEKNQLEKLIDNNLISDDLIFQYNLLIEDIKDIEFYKQEEQRTKDKWYKRKDFIRIFFSDLITFTSNEKGFNYQENYAEYIRLIITAIFLNTITVESLTNFPKSGNLPEEILETLKADFYQSKRKIKSKTNEVTEKIDLDYANYSEIFTYTRLIQHLSIFNLDFIKKKVSTRNFYKFQFDDVKDIFSGYAIEEIITPGEPIGLMKFHEDRFWKTKGKEIIAFWKITFQFDYYLNQQCLVSLIAYFESFLNNSIITLNNYSLNYYIHSDSKRFVDPKDFDNQAIERKIRNLINLGLINSSWKIGNEDFDIIINASWNRNKIVHKRDTDEQKIDELSKTYIGDFVISIAKLSNELYNNIARKLKE